MVKKAKEKVVIIGAGITGLALGNYLSEEYEIILLEKEKTIGGMCASFNLNGFTLDYGPHKLYPQTPESLMQIESFFKENPEELLRVNKRSKLFLKNKFFEYPLQLKELLLKFNSILASKMILSYISSSINNLGSKEIPKDYENFLISKFGKEIYTLVFKSNAEKIWGNPKNLSSDLAKTRLSSPNLIQVILSTLKKSNDPKVNAQTFYYPKNSMGDLMERMANQIIQNKGKIYINSKIKSIQLKNKKVDSLEFVCNKQTKKIKPLFVFSTAHLKELLSYLPVTSEIQKNLSSLKFRDLALSYLFVNKEKILEDNWMFFPERDFIFQRISEQKSFSSFNQPKDKSVLISEVSIRTEILEMSDKELSERIVQDLEKINLLKKEEVLSSFVIRKKEVYPIYSLDYKENLDSILAWLDENASNLISCGRNGLFNYNNMDHCVDMAYYLAKHIKRNGTIENLRKLRKYFQEYKIVD